MEYQVTPIYITSNDTASCLKKCKKGLIKQRQFSKSLAQRMKK